MNREEQAAQNVVELQEIFTKSFAVYGTALGSLREKNVIEHDLDIDLGIFSEDFEWSDLEKAICRGYTIHGMFGMRFYGFEVSFEKNGIKSDLMLFYKYEEDQTKVFNCLWDNGGRDGIKNAIIHEYDIKLFETHIGTLGYESIRTLGEEYVKHVYGPDWRIPVTTWDWKTDHKCIKK